jgi:hypothetical protein
MVEPPVYVEIPLTRGMVAVVDADDLVSPTRRPPTTLLRVASSVSSPNLT